MTGPQSRDLGLIYQELKMVGLERIFKGNTHNFPSLADVRFAGQMLRDQQILNAEQPAAGSGEATEVQPRRRGRLGGTEDQARRLAALFAAAAAQTEPVPLNERAVQFHDQEDVREIPPRELDEVSTTAEAGMWEDAAKAKVNKLLHRAVEGLGVQSHELKRRELRGLKPEV